MGILSVKDLLQTMAERGIQREDAVAVVLRPAYFVPETKLIGELFFRNSSGGTANSYRSGPVRRRGRTGDPEAPSRGHRGTRGRGGRACQEEFAAIGENAYEVEAGVAIQEVNDDLGLAIPEGSLSDSGGLHLERLGHIPQVGEHLFYKNLRLEVTEMRRLKIERVQVRWVELSSSGATGEPAPQHKA